MAAYNSTTQTKNQRHFHQEHFLKVKEHTEESYCPACSCENAHGTVVMFLQGILD